MLGRKRSVAEKPVATPQHNPPHHLWRGSPLLTIVLSLLTLIALLHLIAVTHTAYPTITPTDCTGLIRNADYTKYVPSLTKTQQLDAIQFTSELTAGQPSALLQVADNSPQHRLDVYLYGCFMQQKTPTLALLFKQQGLLQGTVNITRAHTLSIGQLDSTLSPDSQAFLQPLQQNVYQEYSWSSGTFTQTTFPGLYPVIDRSEAEALQDQANAGQTLPWSDPTATATQMAQDLFHWSNNNIHTQFLDNDGSIAHILLTQQHPHLEVTVALARLVQNNNKGLWFVTGAQSQDITLDQTGQRLPIASPMPLRGTLAHKLADDHTATLLFDHTLSPIALLSGSALTVQANGSYTGTIFYTSTLPNQPGLLLIEDLPSDKSKDPGQLLLASVLLG